VKRTPWLLTAPLLGGLACSTAGPSTAIPTASSSPGPATAASPQGALAGAAASTLASAAASAAAAPDPTVLPGPPAISATDAVDILFPTGAPSEADACKREGDATTDARAQDEAKIRCLLRVRFTGDDAARDLAIGFYDKLGSVTGIIREHDMAGGWRGDIHLVPELPVGQYRKHLQWVKAGFEDIDAFFTAMDARRPKGSKAHYRHRALSFRFLRSVGRTTPSAYAQGWEVSYNVSGSLHANADAVRETLFHEVFHSNDAAHGQWSQAALSPIADAILEKCGQKTACLSPYAPGTTMVRGGTYYAFQKGNGVHEYAAELGTRYFLEHRAILRGERHAKGSFKCGPPENARAWKLIADELFGVDLTPECGAK